MDPIILIIWLGLSIGVGLIAKERGHSCTLFVLLSLLLSPLIGIIAACAIPAK